MMPNASARTAARRPPSPQAQRGFSLLELLVAFTIMAMSLGLIYKAMGTSARNAGDISTRQQALMLADALLQSRDAVTGQGWSETGTHGRFAWQASTAPWGPASPGLLPLHQLNIVVSWADGTATRQITAQTLLPQRQPYPGEPVQ
jgi:general secretion pathway protein I